MNTKEIEECKFDMCEEEIENAFKRGYKAGKEHTRKETLKEVKDLLNKHYEERCCNYSNRMLEEDECFCKVLWNWLESEVEE